MARAQRTLARATRPLRGTGLHGGVPCSVVIEPAGAGAGIVFRRAGTDIPARIANVSGTARCTALAAGPASVRTVEHVLAACFLAGLDNAVVSVSAEELPAADGSALPFLAVIREAALVEQDRELPAYAVGEETRVSGAGGWTIDVAPAEEPSFAFRFRGGGGLDGKEARFTPGMDAPEGIAAARTFCFETEIEALRAAGLGRGGDAKNVLVIRADGTAVNGERMPGEAIRHKLLDLIGDFALAGRPIAARVSAVGTGHAAHVECLRTLIPKLAGMEVPADGA